MVQVTTADEPVKVTILKGYKYALKELATAFHEESERANMAVLDANWASP